MIPTLGPKIHNYDWNPRAREPSTPETRDSRELVLAYWLFVAEGNCRMGRMDVEKKDFMRQSCYM